MSDKNQDAIEGSIAGPSIVPALPNGESAFQKSGTGAGGKIDQLKKQLQEEETRKTNECAQAIKAICEKYGRIIVAQPVILPNGSISANILITPEPQQKV